MNSLVVLAVCVSLLALALALAPGGRRWLAGLLALLAGALGLNGPALAEKPPPARTPVQQPKEESSLSAVTQTAEWQRLKQAWARLTRLGAKLASPGDWEKKREVTEQTTNAARAELGQIDRLRDRGLLSPPEARSLAALFEDRIGHVGRAGSGRTCYKMGREAHQRMVTREQLEEQLRLLEDFRSKGTLRPEAYRKVKASIERNLTRFGLGARARALVLELTGDGTP